MESRISRKTGEKMEKVRQLIGCDCAYKKRIYGSGVGIAILDSGVSKHLDLQGRVKVFQDYVKGRQQPYDDNSHGTHIAGIICGSGGCSKGRFMGVAPLSHLIICKVLNEKGDGDIQSVLQALEWIVENAKAYRIRIINVSVGASPREEDREERKLLDMVEYAWSQGFVVVAAAGNNGPDSGSVTTPGISRKIITVGTFDGETIKRKEYSGRGPTDTCVMKPEIISPGNEIVSCYGKNAYKKMSGTSMATPVVSGAIALLLEKNPNMTPKDVKYCLYKTAKDCGYSKRVQGWGLIDVKRMMEY